MNAHPTQDEVEKRIEEVPEGLWEIALSEGVSDEIDRLSSDLLLPDDKKAGLARVVGLVFLGFIDQSHFRDTLEPELNLVKEQMDKLIDNVNANIFSYISHTLSKFYVTINESLYASESTNQIEEKEEKQEMSTEARKDIVQTPQFVPEFHAEAPVVGENNVVLKPNIRKEEPPTEPLASPFVLHEHEDVESARGTINYTENLARPSFHISGNYGTHAEGFVEPTPAARLELGAQVEPGTYIEPKTTKVGREEARVVHYSAPDISADPFSGTPKQTTKPNLETTPFKPNVPQNNIVNLKDLPK